MKTRLPIVTAILIAVTALLNTSVCYATEDTTKTILITGANRGLGLELARQYTATGWQVIGTARTLASAEELRGLGVQVMQLDVTDQESVDRLALELHDRSIDVLINNAGIQRMAWTVPEINFDDVEQSLAVNTVGPMRVTHALLPLLQRGQLKKIINITSNLGSINDNTNGGFYGYRESKAALNMFSRSLAAELKPSGFICIALHPGWVQTDMGGPNAPLLAPEAVQGMRRVIDNLTPEDNGTFWTYAGEQMAW